MVANLLEKGADVDARNEVRIDMFVGPMSIKSFVGNGSSQHNHKVNKIYNKTKINLQI
jgi:hypothetical protein